MGCLVGGVDKLSFRSASLPWGSVSGRTAGMKEYEAAMKEYEAAMKEYEAAMKAAETQKKKIKTARPVRPDVVKEILKVMTDQVRPDYKKQSMDTPCLANRQRVYWSGGAAWATATFTHPEWALDGWVIISKTDLNGFLARLKDGTWNQGEMRITFPIAKPQTPQMQTKIRDQAAKDRADVQNVFSREDLVSGVSIMKTILEVSNPTALVQFVRNGNFIDGYALEQYRADRESAKASGR